MKIKIFFFGITTDLVGNNKLEIIVEEGTSVAKLKTVLKQKYKSLKNIDSYAIAVNEEYAKDDLILEKNDIVAIIPPVSGG